jgi:hypothetical protein
MELHSTTNAQNTQLSAGPRFSRRMIPVAIAAGLFVIACLFLRRFACASFTVNPFFRAI